MRGRKKNFFEIFEDERLSPNHEVSQWYMYVEDMQKQVEYLHGLLNCEKIVFLGDGDGISILMALMLTQKPKSNVKEIFVFDIDERELNLYKRLAEKFNVSDFVKFNVVNYNVFDKIPEKYKNYFDFFYINPPYSYTTKPAGLGFSLWLERCVELTTASAEGCVVYPVEHGENDIHEVKENLFNFIKDKNFQIIDEPSIIHRYHESECISKNVIIKKSMETEAQYAGKDFPHELLKSLYHYCDNPPQYIKDDGTTYGKWIAF